MDFENTARSHDYLERLEAFIADEVVPREDEVEQARQAAPAAQPTAVEELKRKAMEAGLWNLNVRHPQYGPGLSSVEYAPLAERLGRSRLAQEATNTDAPSSINGDALIAYGSSEQRERWLLPQLAGQIRSAFAMTEPQVASSDASNMAMVAERDGDGWRLTGRKWWISGVLHPNCAYLMTMTNTAHSRLWLTHILLLLLWMMLLLLYRLLMLLL